jgi:hypothetical protein
MAQIRINETEPEGSLSGGGLAVHHRPTKPEVKLGQNDLLAVCFGRPTECRQAVNAGYVLVTLIGL